MGKRELLLTTLSENNGIITTEEALKLGVHKDVLKELTLRQEIVKIANGLYGLPGEEIDDFLYFSYRIPKGIFSHETAAYLHNLCTRMPLIYVMTVKVGDNITRVKAVRNNIIFKYSNKEIYNLGLMKMESPYGRLIPVYDKEKTILDMIKNRERIDSYVFSETMKSYFGGADKNLLVLSKYAIRMRMEELLNQYTEVLL